MCSHENTLGECPSRVALPTPALLYKAGRRMRRGVTRGVLAIYSLTILGLFSPANSRYTNEEYRYYCYGSNSCELHPLRRIGRDHINSKYHDNGECKSAQLHST